MLSAISIADNRPVGLTRREAQLGGVEQCGGKDHRVVDGVQLTARHCKETWDVYDDRIAQ
jgi:hypothetical protein